MWFLNTHCAIIAELYEYKASPETMWKGEEESENQIQESLVAKEISFWVKMLKKKNNHVKIQMTRFSEPTVKRISISKIVSECKKRDDQLSRREISRNYLYRTSHQEMWCVITRLVDSRTRV